MAADRRVFFDYRMGALRRRILTHLPPVGRVIVYGTLSTRRKMMKSLCLFGAALIFSILPFISDQSQSQQYSPEFQSLLNHVQQTYLAPKGRSLSSFRNEFPTIVATLIGHALRQQMVFVQQNSSLSKPFASLQREAQAYITEVARTTPARLQDGSLYTPRGLLYLMDNALQGTEDGWVLQSFGVQTGTMPSVFVIGRSPQPQPQPVDPPVRYTPTIKEEGRKEKKGVDQLDREAPPAKVKESDAWEPPPAAIAPRK
jgi:hypothetical protein